jgi:hypothetical protein
LNTLRKILFPNFVRKEVNSYRAGDLKKRTIKKTNKQTKKKLGNMRIKTLVTVARIKSFQDFCLFCFVFCFWQYGGLNSGALTLELHPHPFRFLVNIEITYLYPHRFPGVVIMPHR